MDQKKEIKDNLHEQPMEFYTAKYREADPVEIARRLDLPYDGRYFSLRFLNRDLKIAHPEFSVTPELADIGAKILILRYLLFAKKTPFNGELSAFRDFPGGDLYIQPFTGRCINRMRFKYGSKIDVFRRACEGIGGKEVSYADACYDIELFDGLFVRLILWEGDEEFPASAQILFSSNFRDAFETYDLAETGGILLNAMKAFE